MSRDAHPQRGLGYPASSAYKKVDGHEERGSFFSSSYSGKRKYFASPCLLIIELLNTAYSRCCMRRVLAFRASAEETSLHVRSLGLPLTCGQDCVDCTRILELAARTLVLHK